MPININEILTRYNDAVSRRTKYNTLMQEAGQYAWPSAQDMVRNANQTEALLRTVELYDSTALMAAYRMTSGIFTYLMPVGAKWFEFTAQLHELNNDPTMQEWLSIATALTHKEIWRSNFQREMFITIRSMIVFGTGVISVEKIGDEIVFKSHHIGFVFFDVNSRGEIDTVYRQIFYTARQAAQEFGRNNLPVDIIKALEKDQREKFEFVHVVAPNGDFDSSKIGANSKRVKSLYIYIKNKKVVKKGGFDELPYFIARFSLAPQEIMGRGPAIEYLPEIKMLNRMKKSFIESAEKAVNPPLIVEDDGVVGQPVTSANGMIYVRAGAMKPEPLNTGTNVALNAEIIRDQQTVVKDGFFNSLFRTFEGLKNISSATESMLRKEDDLSIVSPAITSLQKEIFNLIILRVLNLSKKAKRIPEPPIGFDFDIVYQGRLALAMSNVQTNAIEATLAKWQPYDERLRVFDNVNPDTSFRTSWLNAGAPAEGLRDISEVEEGRAADAQLQEAVTQSEIAESGSKAYRNVLKAPEQGSIAEEL